MKVKIAWTETATYEVTIDTPMTLEQLKDGDDWFDEVDRLSPNWIATGLVEVSDRDLVELEKV